MESRKFILRQESRDTIIIVCALLTYLAHEVLLKSEVQKLILIICFAVLALALSAIYIITNKPLTRKEIKTEIFLNGLIVLAISNFMYKAIILF